MNLGQSFRRWLRDMRARSAARLRELVNLLR